MHRTSHVATPQASLNKTKNTLRTQHHRSSLTMIEYTDRTPFFLFFFFYYTSQSLVSSRYPLQPYRQHYSSSAVWCGAAVKRRSCSAPPVSIACGSSPTTTVDSVMHERTRPTTTKPRVNRRDPCVIRVRLKIIRNLQTMHDSDLHKFLMREVWIIFKRTRSCTGMLSMVAWFKTTQVIFFYYVRKLCTF